MNKWCERFLELARLVASWSKDPNTHVGAVIVRPDRTIAAVGFNGFPRGIADDGRLADRETKLEIVVHAEVNAILHASEPLAGCTLYTWPISPCPRCAGAIIQAGIVRVVAPKVRDDHALGVDLLREAGVRVDVLA